MARPGVSYIDHIAASSNLMRSFRRIIAWLLSLGYVIAAVVLYPSYRTRTWRALAPALFATLAAMGTIGWMGQSLNLFSMIGQVLVLGMGVDYGIFMQGKRGSDFGAAILGVTLAAMSTLLSFGLLTFSSTPALANFGLSVLVGIGFSWILAPCFVETLEI